MTTTYLRVSDLTDDPFFKLSLYPRTKPEESRRLGYVVVRNGLSSHHTCLDPSAFGRLSPIIESLEATRDGVAASLWWLYTQHVNRQNLGGCVRCRVMHSWQQTSHERPSMMVAPRRRVTESIEKPCCEPHWPPLAAADTNREHNSTVTWTEETLPRRQALPGHLARL